MTLIVEDGTGVADANTLVDVAGVQRYAELRGVDLGEDDDQIAAWLIMSMDYIESKEPSMKGVRTDPEQSLSFPRTGMNVIGVIVPGDSIPNKLKQAQSALVVAQKNGAILMPNVDYAAKQIKSKQVDVLKTEYFSPKEAGFEFGQSPDFPLVEALLRPFLRHGGAQAMGYRG